MGTRRGWPARTTAACAAVLGTLIAAAPAGAAEVGCRAERAGGRALVQISVADLFDRELLRLVELGLTGRLHFDVTLYRARRYWLDARVGELTHLARIAWSKPAERFTLDGDAIASAARFSLPTLSLAADAASLATDPHYVKIVLRLEVVTAASLGQVMDWLIKKEDGETQAAGGIVPRALVSYVAQDLVRTVRGRCAVEK